MCGKHGVLCVIYNIFQQFRKNPNLYRSNVSHYMLRTVIKQTAYRPLGLRTMSAIKKKSPELAEIVKVEPLDAKDARWTCLQKITYKDPNGAERPWESASRPTRPATSEIDAVAVLAVLRKPTGPEIVLQRQFRPPTGGVCIEVPAGLVDPNESIETTAIRELKEETGYIGTVVSKSPVIFSDPGFCSTNLRLVTVDIDLNDERNRNPVAELEENEFIETFSVPLKVFSEELLKLNEKGYKIDARVQNIAEGIKIAQRFSL